MLSVVCPLFSLTPTATPELYTLSLHDALPISSKFSGLRSRRSPRRIAPRPALLTRQSSRSKRSKTEATRESWRSILDRSEEHTSELQSLRHLVCRLLLEKKKSSKVKTKLLINE